MEEDQINDKEKEIVDYISDREIFYSEQIKDKVKDEVIAKFGDGGASVYKQLNEASSDPTENESDCPDCAKKAQEWIEQSKQSLIVIEDCLDESLSEIANSIITDADGSRISKEDIINGISKATGKPSHKIKDKEIEKICRKILFIGMIDGWLVDEYFIDMNSNEEEPEDGEEDN